MCERPAKLSWRATKYIDYIEGELDHEYRLTEALENRIKKLEGEVKELRGLLKEIQDDIIYHRIKDTSGVLKDYYCEYHNKIQTALAAFWNTKRDRERGEK